MSPPLSSTEEISDPRFSPFPIDRGMERDFLCRDRAAEKLSMLFQSRATVELEPVVPSFLSLSP